MENLIKAMDLSKTFEGKLLFENASFNVFKDDCIGLLGSNGCGKTTLFKIILGWEKPSTGLIKQRDNLKIRYLDQVAISSKDKTVYDFFIRTTQLDSIRQKIKAYEIQLEKPDIYNSLQYEEIYENLRKLRISANNSSCNVRWEASQILLKKVGLENLSPKTFVNSLSGGERQKIALASVLSQPKECDILLLDEPTNHLDIETIEWLEKQIVDFPNAVMVISHDRYLLDDLVDRVFEIRGGQLEKYNTTYAEYGKLRKIKDQIKIKAYKKSKAEINRQKTVIETMSRRNKYNRQISSKINRLAKEERVENPIIKSYLLKLRFNTLFKSGKNVAEGQNIVKRFDDKTILDNVNFEIFAGQKICLIGPNGCGKTTFLKILTGEEKYDDGSVHISSGVSWGYFDQGHLSLNPNNSLYDELRRDQKNISDNDAKALLGQFNFRGNIIFNKVKQVSGGERARLAILRLILQPHNFLILDEPTNHMDMESKTAIESALNSYSGTIIAVSHDRRFLDKVADTIFYMNNNSIKIYRGNYTNFRLQRLKELENLSGSDLAYLSTKGLKKYVVCKSFTIWKTNTKHKVGDEVFIGDHNEELYEWVIKNNFIKLVN
ncbi:ABC-F family ATP-binding cassette domain-containing protein [Thermoplasmatota archaeon]